MGRRALRLTDHQADRSGRNEGSGTMREFPNLEDVDFSPRLAATGGAALDVSEVGLTRSIALTVVDGGRSSGPRAWMTGGLLQAADWQVAIKRAVDIIGAVA